ncbi:MAG: AraC family transcriptional regulator [Lentisphaeria bacterium]|nr:AraC family transcriptional regulator [Lentisphaeria bacterium]
MIVENWAFRINEFGRKSVTPDIWTSNQFNPFGKIYLPHGGEGYVGVGEHWVKFEPGKIYFIPPWTPLDLKCINKFDHSYIHLELLDQNAYSLLQLIGTVSSIVEKTASQETTNYFYKLVQLDYTNEQNALQVQGFLRLILANFINCHFHQGIAPQKRFQKLLEFIENNLSNGLQVKDLAKEVQLTEAHFSTSFKAQFRISPKKYLIERQISKSKFYLLTSKLSIKEIASLVGINDSLYLSRMFKKITGTSPRDYRKKFYKNN